ncbi:MAG TPA: hypothetical protein VMI75_03625 [Polyangiaceae bacterium]|nr:hypothetical protein [Polyangiaceae bacterium]
MTRETAAPDRNFTLSTEERVRALVAGLPAFVRRLRTIEDLEAAIVRLVASGQHERQAKWLLDRLNDLVSRHNRYYPIEAELPIDPRTGELLDRDGKHWKPMPARSLENLRSTARA